MRDKIIYLLSGLFFLVVSFKKAPEAGFKTPVVTCHHDTISPRIFSFVKIKTAHINIRPQSDNNESTTGAPVNISPNNPAVNLATQARAELKAYLDTLMIDPNSIALMQNAKAAINNNLTDPVSNPADPDEGTFFPMGPWDNAGVPTYLEANRDVISAPLLSFLKTALPENADASKLHPQYLASSAASDLVITQTADVFITFVSGRAGHLNTIGYYTYPTNNPPKTAADITEVHYIFPNASSPGPFGNLEPGSKVNLGSFSAGTSIGFVLLPNAYSYTTQNVNTEGLKFYSTPACNPETNPGLKKHTVLLAAPQNCFCIGFEDQDKEDNRCGNDFNGVVIYASSNIGMAISTKGVVAVGKSGKR